MSNTGLASRLSCRRVSRQPTPGGGWRCPSVGFIATPAALRRPAADRPDSGYNNTGIKWLVVRLLKFLVWLPSRNKGFSAPMSFFLRVLLSPSLPARVGDPIRCPIKASGGALLAIFLDRACPARTTATATKRLARDEAICIKLKGMPLAFTMLAIAVLVVAAVAPYHTLFHLSQDAFSPRVGRPLGLTRQGLGEYLHRNLTVFGD